jgi:hypothetical protein
MADDDLKKINERLDAIEQALQGASARARVADLTPDEVQAFAKVRDILAFEPGGDCGINECFRCITFCRPCSTCSICSVCRPCDIECICGPCNICVIGTRAGRFGNLGG